MKIQKVFGIGFHKTGTTSLGDALEILGYRVVGAVGVFDPDIKEKVWEVVEPFLQEHDAFQDNPWPLLYRELDRRYPGSKFILTLRPTKSWLQSAVRHFRGSTTPMREWIYGVGDPVGAEKVYVERYERHNREVEEYFRNRPNDLLTLNLTEGEGWKELCGFLGVSVPDIPFPHSGKAEEWDRYKEEQEKANTCKE